MELNRKVAIITGATSGIGKATAVKFAHEGAVTYLVGSRRKKEKNWRNSSDRKVIMLYLLRLMYPAQKIPIE